MATDQESANKIFLLLQSNGYIVLDKDHLWDGCETPELDPSIEMSPVSIRKLVERLQDRKLEWTDVDDAKNLKTLLAELKKSTAIIKNTISKITELNAK